MNDSPETSSDYPQAEVRSKKSFSLVWLIPIVAVVVGMVMAVQAIVTKGPLITVTFSNATGLVSGQTEVRYKDVTVGLVESIHLNDDLSSVLVEARMDNSIKPYLLDTTQFWIETARISGGEISGLDTLLSGVFIGMDPGDGTESERLFEGTDTPPVVTTGLPGSHFFLEAETLGSINIKNPVYFRQIKVGEVVSYQLMEDGSGVRTQIFINEPYDRFVKTLSRFWIASGIDFTLDAQGIQVDTESLTSILYGGISFDTPIGFDEEVEAESGAVFRLFKNHGESLEEHYLKRSYYFAQFPHSVRGLKPGSPVEFLGFKIGEVVDMKLEFDVEKVEFSAPILFYVEPERIHVKNKSVVYGEGWMDEMVRRGLRVQLENGNLLTGQLYIDLVIHESIEVQKIDYSMAHPLLPSVPSDVEALTSSVRSILDDLKMVNFQRIGNDLHETLTVLNRNLEKTDKLFTNLNTTTTPRVDFALEDLRLTLRDLRDSFGSESNLNQDARLALIELTKASRSFKVLTDYLSEHPEAIVSGKDNSE